MNLEPMTIGLSDEERRRREAEESERASAQSALDATVIPEVPPSSLAPLGREGEARDAIASVADPEASSATAHTLEGSWDDATSEPDGPPSPNLDEADAEMLALRSMSQRDPVRTPELTPSIQPLRQVSQGPLDDEPDEQPMGVAAPEAADLQADAPPSPMDPAMALGAPQAPEAMPRETVPGEVYNGPTPDEDGDVVEPDGDADDAESMALAEMSGRAKPAPTEEAPMLDDGLPSDGDIRGARQGDAVEEILHRLGNAFRGAAGQSATPFHGRADALQERRDGGMRERLQAKGVQRREEGAAAQAEASAASEAAARAEASRRADEGLAMQRERLDLSRLSTESSITGREAATARAEAESQRRLAESGLDADPTSPASQAERMAFGAARLTRLRRPEQREEIDALLRAEGIDPAHASAAQLRRMTDIVRSIGVRGGAGGGAGGGGDPTRPGSRENARDQLRSLLEQRHADTAVVNGLDDSRVQQMLASELTATGRRGVEEGRMVVYGDAEGSEVTADGRTFGSPAALNDYQSGLATASDMADQFRELENIYGRVAGDGAGLGGRLAAWARLQSSGETEQPIGILLGTLTEMARTGVINPGPEAERLANMLPNPASLSQMTFDQFSGRMEQFRRGLASQITSRARMHGIVPEDTQRLLRTIGVSGASAPSRTSATETATPPAPTSDMVTYRTPSGRTARGPRGVAPPAGWEVIDGP